MPAIRHRALAIDGLNVFVREAGLPGNPAGVLWLPLAHPCPRRGRRAGAAALSAWWADLDTGQAAVDGFVSLAGTQQQWQAGARKPRAHRPEQTLADQLVLDLPGRADYMKALLWDYQNNVTTPRRGGSGGASRPSSPSGARTTRSSSLSAAAPLPRNRKPSAETQGEQLMPSSAPAPAGKTIVITGGTSGIGLDTARLLAAGGAHVTVIGDAAGCSARRLAGTLRIRDAT
jgi:hypothetical protein